MINYNYSKDNWIVEENKFDRKFLGKTEVIMALGNGYMGMRSTTEEKYLGETRNFFISGTFNKAYENEVTELPNVADLIELELNFDGERFDLEKGEILSYSKRLNLKNGELIREVTWKSESGKTLKIVFNRFISKSNLHVVGQKITIEPAEDVKLEIVSGINGQMSNSGVQHFIEGDKRFYEHKFIQLVQTTSESNVSVVLNTVHKHNIDGKEITITPQIGMDRRKIFASFVTDIPAGSKYIIEKLSNVYTSRDKEFLDGFDIDVAKEQTYSLLKEIYQQGYNELFAQSEKEWLVKWEKCDITIKGSDIDQLASRFAQYHLTIMTPAHDNRMNIGAKGLTGEGYKGHTFWDTEIFMLPYWIYSDPKVARSLLEYRYNSLEGAHKKSTQNNYEGAQFPWESAWLDDGEVTPVWGAADIITGKPTKIWSGFIEQHITSCVAFGTWQYYNVTKDEQFIDNFGYELLLDTAKFWSSRLEYNNEKDEYHINNVIGPDEYKEHINNNAFTNYTAHWNIKYAIETYNYLKQNKTTIFNRLNKKLDLDRVYKLWCERVEKIYLPIPRKDKLIPQDDTYLTLKQIDLTKYKNQKQVGLLFRDYNLDQVNKIQVSKQADIVMLLYLFEDLFSPEIKKTNFDYYEARTLHDSSLSLSTHTILSNDLNYGEEAYKLFRKAADIDLGTNMKSSDHGIHAASLGGVWQSIVFGFGGVRMLNDKLRIEPKLPSVWNELSFDINVQGDILSLKITNKDLFIENKTNNNKIIRFINNGINYELSDKLHINL